MQHDTLLEKGVILDEVDALTSQLREDAATARPVGASLAAAANAYQERLRKVTRGMMATISELSLYQVRQTTCGITWILCALCRRGFKVLGTAQRVALAGKRLACMAA
jgi:hypothetical protein